MAGELSHMIDGAAFAIVCAGTALATATSCGWSALAAAWRELVRLPLVGLDIEANQAALASCARAIQRDGPLRARIALPPDPWLSAHVERFLRARPQEELLSARRAERAERDRTRKLAARTLESAGELAPVFGLVGTLFAITQLPPAPGGDPVQSMLAGIATAVLSTLYGVLLAQFVCIPLARAILRKGEREERQREALIGWFARCLDDTGHAARARVKEAA